MNLKNKSNFYLSCVAAILSALSTVFVYFMHFPNAIGGYIHIGDAIVYLTAALLPKPYAAVSAAMGFGLADLLSGYPVYILPSAFIRALVVLCFTAKKNKILCRRNYAALPLSLVITVGGYFITKYIIYQFINKMPEVAVTKAVASVPGNIIQCASSAVVFILVSIALDKMNFKEKIKLSGVNKNV